MRPPSKIPRPLMAQGPQPYPVGGLRGTGLTRLGLRGLGAGGVGVGRPRGGGGYRRGHQRGGGGLPTRGRPSARGGPPNQGRAHQRGRAPNQGRAHQSHANVTELKKVYMYTQVFRQRWKLSHGTCTYCSKTTSQPVHMTVITLA